MRGTDRTRNDPLADRQQAGRLLAEELEAYTRSKDCLVLGLPRGGVVVAYEIATHLGLSLDVCIVRKLGVPDQPELAMGAIADGGVTVLDRSTIEALGVTDAEVAHVIREELKELERRQRTYRGTREFPPVGGQTVILVDDGLATGATAEAAARSIRSLGARRIILAVGVAAPESIRRLHGVVDEVVSVLTPVCLSAIGAWYDEFSQTSDQQVHELLAAAAGRELAASACTNTE